eukprot:Gb_18019 [translate_table: standard]
MCYSARVVIWMIWKVNSHDISLNGKTLTISICINPYKVFGPNLCNSDVI